jgi:hypothetical protein
MAYVFFTALAVLTLIGTAEAEQPRIQNVISYTFYADGKADAVEHVPAWIGNQRAWIYGETEAQGFHISGQDMPSIDLWVIGAALSMQYMGMHAEQSAQCWAMSGIAGGGGDYLIPLFTGPGTKTVMFPAGYAMKLVYGPIANKHIDLHVWCPKVNHGSWVGRLTIWTVPVNPADQNTQRAGDQPTK